MFLFPDPPSSPLKPATEVIFLLDTSQNVSRDLLKVEKELVTLLLQHFNISVTGPRGAVIAYADRPSLTTNFGEDFSDRINSIPLSRAAGRIDRALQYASQLFARSDRNGRKIAILLTASRRNSSLKQLRDAEKSLRLNGAQTFAIALTEVPDIQELLAIVHRSDDIFRVSRGDILSIQSRDIAEKIRNKRGMIIGMSIG